MKKFLAENFVLAFHNQLPELYCNNSVNPGANEYPEHQVNTCSEGAGGGNVRCFVCTPEGKILSLSLGYWKPERFLEETRFSLDVWRGRVPVEDLFHTHMKLHERRKEGVADNYHLAVQNLFLRAHREARADFGKPIREVLQRIEDDIYLKGKIG